MYATYHLASAEEVGNDIIEAIKATFKSKPITIIVEESPISNAQELEAFLLTAPTFTVSQINAVNNATKSIAKWRTK
jgi:hypothetical protein